MYSQISKQLFREVKEALNKSRRNPGNHRCNFGKAHRTRFRTSRIPCKLLVPLHCEKTGLFLGQPPGTGAGTTK